MAAVLTTAAKTAIKDAWERARKRARQNGELVPPDGATLDADYDRMLAALILVADDAAYASLDTATKAAITALGLP